MQLRLFLTRDQLQEAIGDIDHIVLFVRGKLRRFLKKTFYGSAIAIVSLVVIGGGMYAFGLTPWPEPANAGLDTAGLTIAGFLAQLILAPIYVLFGVLSAVFAGILDMVIGYPWSPSWVGSATTSSTAGGGFVNVSAVVTGWRIVRDICNLFFAIILLIIALAAVLNLESYKWQDLLRKFVLYAVLINFSKTICGFFTDAATVAMATFGGNIGISWGAGIIGGFGLPAISGLSAVDNLQTQLAAEDGVLNMLGAIVLMVIFQVIGLAIIAAFVVMLVLRIVMLWFLIVLSPIAYVTRILDITKRYSSQWWELWGRYVMMGPFIVFFLWLTLTMLNGTATGGTGANGIGGAAATPLLQGLTEAEALNQSGSAVGQLQAGNGGNTLTGLQNVSAFQATQPNIIANFAIALVMFMGALRFSSGMAGEVGGYVSSVSDTVGGAANRLVGSASRWASDKTADIRSGKIPVLGLQVAQESKVTRGLGDAADFLANTVLDPVGAFTNLRNNLDRATAEKEKKSSQDFQKLVRSYAEDQSSLGARVVGNSFGTMSEEGALYFRDNITGGNLIKAALSPLKELGYQLGLKKDTSGTITGGFQYIQKLREEDALITQKNTTEKTAMQNLESEKDKLNMLNKLRDYVALPTSPVNLDALEAVIGDDAAMRDYVMHLDDPIVKGAITAQVADLRTMAKDSTNASERAKLTLAADELEEISRGSEDIRMSDLLERVSELDPTLQAALPGAFLQSMREQGIQQNERKEKLRQEIVAADTEGDYVDASGIIIPERLNNLEDKKMLAEDRVTAAQKVVDTARADRERTEMDVNSTRAPINYEAQAAYDRFLEERAKDLEGFDFRELEPEIWRAIKTGNSLRLAAIMKKGSRDQALPWAMRSWISNFADANEDVRNALLKVAHGQDADLNERNRGALDSQIVKDAEGNEKLRLTDSREGIEIFRRGILRENMGMSEQESLRIMNMLAGIEFKNGRASWIGLYGKTPTGFTVNSPDLQANVTVGMLASKTGFEFAKSDENMFVTRDRDGNVVDLIKGGIDQIRQFQQFLTEERNFKSWNSNVKKLLSTPENIEKLKEAGIQEELIKKLEQFHKSLEKSNRKTVRGAAATKAGGGDPGPVDPGPVDDGHDDDPGTI